MTIKTIVIEGHNQNITIARTERGAEVTVEEHAGRASARIVCIAHVARDENWDRRYAKAAEVARYVYGSDRLGRAIATNSMVHDVLDQIERVAGC